MELKEAIKEYYAGIEKDNIRITQDRYHTEYMREDLWICAQSVLIKNEDLLDRIGKDAFEKFGRDADSISVLLLQLSPEEYIESLLSSSEQIGKLQGHIRTIEWRIALVSMVAPIYCDKGHQKLWETEQLRSVAEKSENNELKHLLTRVIGLLENYVLGVKSIFEIYEEDEKREDDERLFGERRAINRLYNRKLRDIFIEYLKLCCKMFEDKEQKIYLKEDLAQLRKIWDKLKNIDNIEDYIIHIRSFIEDYKKNKIFSE